MSKITTKQLVANNAAVLATMSNAELFTWSRANGLDNAAAFSAFKKALLTLGIDYAGRRNEARAEKFAAIEQAAAATVTFYTDAKARTDRFAICDQNGAAVWYGKFFDNDRDYNGEQSSGEMAAAKKAVWLASQVAKAIGATGIRLVLKVDAEWLTWANRVSGVPTDTKRGGQARELGELAAKMGVALEVEHIAGVSNPADKYTVCHGFQSYKDVTLASLVSEANA